MGKIKIKLLPDGTIQMETEGIKGTKCADYAKVFQRLTDAKIYQLKKLLSRNLNNSVVDFPTENIQHNLKRLHYT